MHCSEVEGGRCMRMVMECCVSLRRKELHRGLYVKNHE